MAASSSSSSGMDESFSINTPTIPSALKYVMSSIKTIAQTPLTYDNYHIWSSQIMKLLHANSFEPFLDTSNQPPPKFFTATEGNLTPNPAHASWTLIDQNLSALILSTISNPILPYVLKLNTTAEIWQSLSRHLQASTSSRILQLKNELHHVSMKSNTMNQYLAEIKIIVDQLAAAGAHIDSEDIILYNLQGLPPQYQSFKAAIRTRPGSLHLDEFYSLLSSEEVNIQTENSLSLNNLALSSFRGRGTRPYTRGRGRTSYRGGRTSDGPRPPHVNAICQICNKPSHIARSCWHHQNLDYQPTVPPPDHTALLSNTASTAQPPPSEDWFLDTGASSHLTPNFRYLQ